MHNIDIFRPKMPPTHGTARFADKGDLRRGSFFEPGHGKAQGVLIGCVTPAEIGGREVLDLYSQGEGHFLTVAPTGAGKTSGVTEPVLQSYPGSAVVLDLKGTCYASTAGWRQKQGHRTRRFAPFETDCDRWNPIDTIFEGTGDQPNDPVRQENVRFLANLLITPNPNAREPYWDNAAKSLLQGILLYVATEPLAGKDNKSAVAVRERTMAQVRSLIVLDGAQFAELLTAMAQSKEKWVRESASCMLQMAAAREQSAGVKTILMEHTTVWSYERVQRATAKSDFSFAELRPRDKDAPPTTIYEILPFEILDEYRPLIRVMTGCCVRTLRTAYEASQHGDKPPVLLILDEFPQLGYMKPIEDALLYLRSYAVRLWFFVQDIGQLKEHYPKTWQSFFANCAVRSFFGVSDIDTAKLVSEMSGLATVRNRSYQAGINEGESTSDSTASGHGSTTGMQWSSNTFNSRTFTTSRSRGSSFGSNLGYVGRPLFMPDEVMRMPEGAMLIFVRGFPVIRGQLPYWFEKWPERGRIAPPH